LAASGLPGGGLECHGAKVKHASVVLLTLAMATASTGAALERVTSLLELRRAGVVI
jgi:hypothetical protein